MLFSFPVQNLTEIGQSPVKLWPKTIFSMTAIRILNFKNFHIWSSGCYWVPNLLLCTKFHRNLMIFRWYMAIWQFSRWQISAILNFMGPVMESLKSPCSISYRSSIEAITLNCLSFWENRTFVYAFWRQADRQTRDGLYQCLKAA